MIRLAQVLAGGEQGGAENMFTRTAIGLQQTGSFDQRVYLRNHPARLAALEAAGCSCRHFRFGSALHFLDRWQYQRDLRAFAPDVVLTWMNRASIATPAGDYKLVSRLGSYYDLKYYRHADYWIGISKGICDHLIKGGMPADKVFMIPNFVDEAEVEPLPRDSFDTPADAPLILSAGRLHPVKGFDILIRALKRVPDAILWLAGAGPEDENLRSLAKSEGVADRIRFLGWRSDVTRLVRTADLFVCSSRHEGLGSIVLESWAHGCPIVATDSQGPGELIEHGVTGLLTPVDEVAPLADAINQVLGDSTLAQALADNAGRQYDKHYRKSVIIGQYQQLLTQLANSP
ncbi:glycosyltransferase [Simiduia agarivorans]|uniref:Group 1 glycosyl transferase n=1 Tax=Simiduia agarivorans (strain DSM 21679 / JCM 13881 / BCRC 17597 / SA1) TaxID=1117647 RepID=K4KL37_SIMAS|nr:glycosyltransferase [Simiduia agarivorans]AFU99716.1 group 1 glycosyl transferase [Simiduia agarivorans SA1 = DSM 21679]